MKYWLLAIVIAWFVFAVFCPQYTGKMNQLMNLYDNPFKTNVTETTSD